MEKIIELKGGVYLDKKVFEEVVDCLGSMISDSDELIEIFSLEKRTRVDNYIYYNRDAKVMLKMLKDNGGID